MNMRDVVLLMTTSQAKVFGEKVVALQATYGTESVVATVIRAIDEAYASRTNA